MYGTLRDTYSTDDLRPLMFIKNSYLDIIDKPKAGDILVARFPPSRLLPYLVWSGQLILFKTVLDKSLYCLSEYGCSKTFQTSRQHVFQFSSKYILDLLIRRIMIKGLFNS